MRSFSSCRVVALCRLSSTCDFVPHTSECAVGARSRSRYASSCKSRCRSRFTSSSSKCSLFQRQTQSFSRSISTVQHFHHDFRIFQSGQSRRMLCTSGKGRGNTTDDSDSISLSAWQDTKLPRRLIKRLKRQGISETEFLEKLKAEETRPAYNDDLYDSLEPKANSGPSKFVGSQEELETLIRDMSVGPKYVSEAEPFPSDMMRYKELERKQTKSKDVGSKLFMDPASTSILLFPGQGSQFVGMGNKLIHFPGVKELYEEASSILGYDLFHLCVNGPKSELDKTVHCQPAVMVTSIAALEKLREEYPQAIENCVATAGFSVGEFAALVFSGVLSFPDAIEVVKTRAESMQRASERVSSGMLSVFLAHDSDLKGAMQTAKEYCQERRGIREPVCQVANFLFPECKVIAGHAEALEFVKTNAKDFRILRTKQLPVSGAFHTLLMESALTPLGNIFKKIRTGIPKLPVYSNLTGLPYNEKTNFGHKLCQQLIKPVKWEQTMHAIYARPQGAHFPQTFEVGPQRQMGTLLKQINLQAHKSYRHTDV